MNGNCTSKPTWQCRTVGVHGASISTPTSMIKRMYEHCLSSLNEVLLTYSALSLIWYVWTEYLKPL